MHPLLSPPPTAYTPRPPRRSRQTKRSRRFAERRLQNLPTSRPLTAIIPSTPQIIKGSDYMSTPAKEILLRRVLNLPNIPSMRKFPPTPDYSPRPPKLNAGAQSFSPTPATRPPSHHLPAPSPSDLGAASTSSEHPIVSPTPSKMGGRLLFTPPRSTEHSPSTPPLQSPSQPPHTSPPPPIPSPLNPGGQTPNINLPPFPRPKPNSGPHHIPPSPNMGGPFHSPSPFSATSSPSFQFFRHHPINVLHPDMLQNIFDCLQSINFFFTSVLTPIPVLLHSSPYRSNSYI